MSMIPWKLDILFEQIQSLFKNENLPYSVSTYLCSCESSEPTAIIHHANDIFDYECPVCGNSVFYDANMAQSNSFWYEPVQNLFSQEMLLTLNPKINIDEQTGAVYFQIAIDIPESFDLIRNKVHYHQKILYETVAESSKPVVQNLYAEFGLETLYDPDVYLFYDIENSPSKDELINRCEILTSFKESLLYTVKTHDSYEYRQELQECKTLEQAAVLIAFPQLKSFEFVHWSQPHLLTSGKDLTILDALDYAADFRKEKSFKKAVYLHYKNSLNKAHKYNFRYVRNIAKNIKDVNIAIRMIKIDFHKHLNETNFDVFYSFVDYLAQRYTPKQIEKLFNEYVKNDPYWLTDTLGFYEEFHDDVESLPPLRCNIQSIHDGFMDSYGTADLMKILSHVNFDYKEKYQNACGLFHGFKFQLPQTGIELYHWGETLRNCLSTYHKKIIHAESTIYGLFKEGTLYAAVEIASDKIIQESTKYNKPLQAEEKELIIRWHQQFFSNNSHY